MKTKSLWLTLAALVLSLTSCFETTESEEIYYLYGVGTYNGSLVVLDTGLQVTGTSNLGLTENERCYLYFSCGADSYETAAANISNGLTGTVDMDNLLQGGKMCQGTYDDVNYDNLADYACTAVDDFAWLTFGGIGNGWLNFSITSSYLYNITTGESIDPECYVFLREWDVSSKTLSLVVLYNNRNDVYNTTTYNTLSSDIPVTFDVSSIYYYLLGEGLSASDSVNLKVYYVADTSHNLGPGYLDATYNSTNYCYVSTFKRSY